MCNCRLFRVGEFRLLHPRNKQLLLLGSYYIVFVSISNLCLVIRPMSRRKPEAVPYSDTGEARKKFGVDVKAISSDMYFGKQDNSEVHSHAARILRFSYSRKSHHWHILHASFSYSVFWFFIDLIDNFTIFFPFFPPPSMTAEHNWNDFPGAPL